MKEVVSDAIRTYNSMRPHASCHYMTTEQMHCQSKQRIKTYSNQHNKNNPARLSLQG